VSGIGSLVNFRDHSSGLLLLLVGLEFSLSLSEVGLKIIIFRVQLSELTILMIGQPCSSMYLLQLSDK
jgi:hypothetical protein